MKLTEAELAVIADAMRASSRISDAQLKRALFAIQPARVKGDVCAVCGLDLSIRPVLTTAKHRDTTISKRVRMKPVQLVITCRREGSHGPRDFKPPEVFWRFCAKCASTMQEETT